ncbi:helix-turn-helix domain-containing protein [Enterococcus sp. DIV0170]|uniref:helix-turn-helix domain-containing protein n=1 Tax=Enterococcus sp. DIV0170 TaxID=2774642 RepID=UPI003F272B5D
MLGEKLKEQRMSLGLTQQEVAEHLHVSRQTISNWEVGRNFPDIPMIISISDYYHISLDELLKGDEQLMDKMKKDAELLKRTKRRKIFDWVFVGLLLLTVGSAFLISRLPDISNQKVWGMLVVGIVFIFSIVRYFVVIPKSDAVSGMQAPLVIPKSFGVGWAINPYHPLGKVLLIGIFVAIEVMIFLG